MRKLLVLAFTAGAVALRVYLQASSSPKADETVKLRVRLVDADTGKDISGIVRAFRVGEDKPLPLPGLYDRLKGLKREPAASGWCVVPTSGGATELPRAKVRLEAVSGLETALATEEIDLGKNPPEEVVLKLRTIIQPEASELVAGNTHLH